MTDATPSTTGPQEEVRQTLRAISGAWRERRYADLRALFAPDMVFAFPGFSGKLANGDAIVETYREFMDRSNLTEYTEGEPSIDIWGDTAVASFGWTMAWESGGVASRESGQDLFVFRRAPGEKKDANQWLAVWRTMIFEKPASA